MRKGAMAPPYAENDVRTTVANCIRFRSISMSAQRTRADCPQTDYIFLMRALFEAPPYLQPAVQANAEPVVLENSPRGQRGVEKQIAKPTHESCTSEILRASRRPNECDILIRKTDTPEKSEMPRSLHVHEFARSANPQRVVFFKEQRMPASLRLQLGRSSPKYVYV
jgi:hypothetical protein